MKLIFRQRMPQGADLSTFEFEPVEPLSWTAGQSIRLELPAPDYGTNERRFTISAAPYEGIIAITTRKSASEFKQSLFALEPGEIIDAYSIEGDFTWEHDKSVVFAAIGIGVTPIYAIIKQRLHKAKPVNAALFYAGKSELPFVANFLQWQTEYPEFALQQLDQRLNPELLYQHRSDKTVYISGPQTFVNELKQALVDDYKLDPNVVKTDLFTGNLSEEG